MPLRLTQIAPGIHRLATRYENWYLLAAGGRLTVLDAGLPGHWDGFASALASLGHTPDDIDAVLITHHHPDHRGNAQRLRSSGARVFAHPADAPYVRGEKRLNTRGVVRYLGRRWYRRYMLHLLANRATRVPPVAELEKLADGEIVDVPGSPRVLHAPGHTAGSCALFLEDHSILFSGDALVTLDMTRGRTGPQIIRGPFSEDADLALESLEVLAATDAETVLPGHGEPWAHGARRAVEIARERS
jgi:glyoxylase-like metal-dependent hydrolase (beta-lactamase superfamily II)